MGVGAGTLATASLIATGVGAAVSAVGAYEQGQASKAAADYNAKVGQQNAQIAKQNAALVGQEGEAQAARTEQGTRAKVGAIKAEQAASGVNVNSGSAVDVRSSAAELGELDALTVRSNAAKAAYGYQVQSTNFENQSNLDKFEGESAATAGDMGAATTLLGGTGKAADMFVRYQQSGAF